MLNDRQQQAIEIIDGPLLLLAGAGAGKTHTLTERVGVMIQQHGIAPESILCVTFTNKAAREMRERLAQKLGIQVTNNFNLYRLHGMPVAGTFHSIGVFFLRQFIDRIGYSKDFLIYDEDDKIKLLKQICEEKKIDEKEVPPRQILFQISAAKNDGIIPQAFE
jgi:DNA helicase-2/ATP-dependent DNA helicase PcrA